MSSTGGLLSQVLNKDYGLRKGKEVIAHRCCVSDTNLSQIIAMTDAANEHSSRP
jgi:uncharacterized protein (DUF2225 family)